MTDSLEAWVKRSHREERRHPERFLPTYDVVFDDSNVWMTQATLDAIVYNCGWFNGRLPQSEYCKKILLRDNKLMWFDEARQLQSREILIKPSGGGPAQPLAI